MEADPKVATKVKPLIMKLPAASGRSITRKYHLYPLTLTLSHQGRGNYAVNPAASSGVLKNTKKYVARIFTIKQNLQV